MPAKQQEEEDHQPEINISTLWEKLGLNRQEVAPDGNCSFYAVLAALGTTFLGHTGSRTAHKHPKDVQIAEAMRLCLWTY